MAKFVSVQREGRGRCYDAIPRYIAAQRRSRQPAIDRAERFYTSVWGLEVVIRDQGSIYLRATAAIIMSSRCMSARVRSCAP